MITYTIDVLIVVAILSILIGLWVGVMFGYWINKSAIEKDQPKKPKVIEFLFGDKIYKCPNCKRVLNQEYKHCHHCGQTLEFKGVKENGTSKIK